MWRLFLIASVFLFAELEHNKNIAPRVTGPIGDPYPIISPVAVAGSGSRFLAAWQDSTRAIYASFSGDRGTSWSSPALVSSDSVYAPSVSSNPQGFVAGWVGVDVGYSLGVAMASVSSDNGKTWAEPQRISPPFRTPGGNVNFPVNISSSRYGFLAVWSSEEGYHNTPWASYSVDGQEWSAAACVCPGASLSYGPVNSAGVGNTWIVTWQTISRQGYAAISYDLGVSWTDPILLASDMANQVPLSIAATSFGYLVGWKTAEGNAYARFAPSEKPSAWGPAILIAEGLANSSTGVSLAGFGREFIACWQTAEDSGFASISTNMGTTWSASVMLTTDGTLHKGYDNLVGLALVPSGGMFVWLNSEGQAMASFALLPNLPYNIQKPPFGPPNEQSGRGIFH